MTDAKIFRLIKLNHSINQLKREIKAYLAAPVWDGSVYDEEFQALPEDKADQYILSREIWTIIPEEVARLAQLCKKRQALLSKA